MRKDSIDLVEMSPRDTLVQRVLNNNIRVHASPPSRPSPAGSQKLFDVTPRVVPTRNTRSIPSLSIGEAAAVLAAGPASEKENDEGGRSLPPLNTECIFDDLSIPRCSSPVPMTAQGPVCSGDCIPSPTLRPMVVCTRFIEVGPICHAYVVLLVIYFCMQRCAAHFRGHRG